MAGQNDHSTAIKIIGGVIILSALLFCGCSKRPKGVLSEKKMVSLIADLQLVESYSNVIGISNYSSDERGNLGRGVLTAHGVTQMELDSTLAWYGRNMDDYSELYVKVDKEISSRRNRLMKEEGQENVMNSGDMLWPYTTHGNLSKLGNSDGWILSIDAPELNRGDAIEWSMRVSESAQFSGVLGVEYEDGTSEAKMQTFSSKQKYVLRLQTDTGKLVKRIYGTMRLKDEKHKPVYSDSITLRRINFDSLEYARNRGSRRYGVPAPIKPKFEKIDSMLMLNDTMRSNNRVKNKQMSIKNTI
ncbi:MAG: DUF4296 domain-containing protein [Bacteroides sp.]|nr:DUF4296 domain-containing protein [Bacteroides sp.]